MARHLRLNEVNHVTIVFKMRRLYRYLFADREHFTGFTLDCEIHFLPNAAVIDATRSEINEDAKNWASQTRLPYNLLLTAGGR